MLSLLIRACHEYIDLLWSNQNLVDLAIESHQGGCQAREAQNALIQIKVTECRHWQDKVKQVLYELVSRIGVGFSERLDFYFTIRLLFWAAAHALCGTGLFECNSTQLVDARKNGCSCKMRRNGMAVVRKDAQLSETSGDCNSPMPMAQNLAACLLMTS